jgi:hypothetical protein
MWPDPLTRCLEWLAITAALVLLVMAIWAAYKVGAF